MNNKNSTSFKGIKFLRLHTKGGKDVYDLFAYEYRDISVKDAFGVTIFEQKQVEVPVHWSDTAARVLAEKYFRKTGVPQSDGTLGGEYSIKQVVHRMANCWQSWGEKESYFESSEDATVFYDEVVYSLLSQQAAPNSPQWLNTGLYDTYAIKGKSHGHYYVDSKSKQLTKSYSAFERPLPHDSFILPVADELVNEGGVMDLFSKEAKIFKFGGSVGTNFSVLRPKGTLLSNGGDAAGLMPFLTVGDVSAHAIEYNTVNGCAIKVNVVNGDHPDILEFIDWKKNEKRKAKVLESAGLLKGFLGKTCQAKPGQKTNTVIRLTDIFFDKLKKEEDWQLNYPTSGKSNKTISAKIMMEFMADAAWECANPGLQFDDTINEWHTCPVSGKINASSPSSEFLFLDNTACNFASINLLSFFDSDSQEFDIEAYEQAIRLWTTVLEISVAMAHFPSKETAQMTFDFRPIGIGYTNLGALLMAMALPYESEQARAICGALSAILTGNAYVASAELAAVKGAFDAFHKNKKHMLRVIRNHRFAAYNNGIAYEGLSKAIVGLNAAFCSKELLEAACICWDKALQLGTKYGFRNAQVSAISADENLGLIMDCKALGIEPISDLVNQKGFSPGHKVRAINAQSQTALSILGYPQKQIEAVLSCVFGQGSLYNAPVVNSDSLLDLGFEMDDITSLNSNLSLVLSLQELFSSKYIKKNVLKKLGIEPDFWENDQSDLLLELGFSPNELQKANQIVFGTLTFQEAPYLNPNHLPVLNELFDIGTNPNLVLGHLKMIAAAQPFISGAISITVELPEHATVQEVQAYFLYAWENGLKTICVFREHS